MEWENSNNYGNILVGVIIINSSHPITRSPHQHIRNLSTSKTDHKYELFIKKKSTSPHEWSWVSGWQKCARITLNFSCQSTESDIFIHRIMVRCHARQTTNSAVQVTSSMGIVYDALTAAFATKSFNHIRTLILVT